MINIDFLPEKEKNNLNLDSWRRLILVFSGAILAGLVIFSSFLVGANWYLLNNLEKSSALLNLHRQLPLGREIKDIEERLTEANDKMNQILKIKTRISPKSFIFSEVASILPEKIIIDSFNVKNGGLAELTGSAQERAALLSFKKNLEENKRISDLNFPLANLLKEKEVEFSLSFKIK
jgi:Tfp pilus assembly protein PilN